MTIDLLYRHMSEKDHNFIDRFTWKLSTFIYLFLFFPIVVRISRQVMCGSELSWIFLKVVVKTW